MFERDSVSNRHGDGDRSEASASGAWLGVWRERWRQLWTRSEALLPAEPQSQSQSQLRPRLELRVRLSRRLREELPPRWGSWLRPHFPVWFQPTRQFLPPLRLPPLPRPHAPAPTLLLSPSTAAVTAGHSATASASRSRTAVACSSVIVRGGAGARRSRGDHRVRRSGRAGGTPVGRRQQVRERQGEGTRWSPASPRAPHRRRYSA